ncbi:hypothetical protein FA95DRAFT_1573256 [Auriscalpium vulgare]|uniref:Uncharacterized protein n=1 Tax=Auriscalpium vulgare TaxID=40419 RepID=A0ACB8RQS6_9AGAM|nr:hypothetical protein FA95DRAFT_1573256 [Auriscalpium vulgare]
MLRLNVVAPFWCALATLCMAQAAPPACGQACGTSAANQFGCSLTDVQCVCTNTDFFDAVSECITDTCPPEDIAAAGSYYVDLCGDVTSSSIPASAFSSAAIPSSVVSTTFSPTVTGSGGHGSGTASVSAPPVTTTGAPATASSASATFSRPSSSSVLPVTSGTGGPIVTAPPNGAGSVSMNCASRALGALAMAATVAALAVAL